MENLSPEDRRVLVDRLHEAVDSARDSRTTYLLGVTRALTDRGLKPGTGFRILEPKRTDRPWLEPHVSVSWSAYHQQLATGAPPMPARPFVKGSLCFHD